MNADKNLRWADYITINIYWLGLTSLSQTLTPLVFPLLVQGFVGESIKGTFVGTLRLWTLMVALLVQSLMGMLSDHSTLRWGRRRPFILIGTLADLVFIAAIGFSAGLEGMAGYWFLFIMALLLSVSTNTAHAAQQGLIPDMVPMNQRGRFSAVKSVLELPVPMIMIAFTVGRLIGDGRLTAGLVVTCSVLTLSMLLTMRVREKPMKEPPSTLNWQPFLRLLLMTALFTAIILGMGGIVKFVARLIAGFSSTAGMIILLGGAGLLAMSVAIGLGVWVSVRAGIGDAARQNPSFTWWVVNRLAYLVPANNLATFAVFFLQGRFGYAREQAAGPASTLIMYVGIFILVFALPSGWLADRFGRKRLLLISGLVSAVGTLIALLAPDLTLLFIGASLIGAATGLFYSANWALGTDLAPEGEAGRYLGISNLAGAGAGAVGAYIGGPIADHFTAAFPQVPGLGYVVLFAIYGVLFLLSTLTLTRIEEPLGV